jgi:hypothetical protein
LWRVNCGLNPLSLRFGCFASGFARAFFLCRTHSLAQFFAPLGHRVS